MRLENTKAELSGDSPHPQESWRCFFCDEVFTDRREAWAHFGEENCETDPPACIDPLRTDEKARLTELREAREYALKSQNEVARAEELAEGLQAEHDNFFRYFGPDVNNMWQAGDRYKNAIRDLAELRAEASRQPSPELADEIVSIVFEEIDRDGDWMSSREFAVERVQKKLRESEHSEPAKEGK